MYLVFIMYHVSIPSLPRCSLFVPELFQQIAVFRSKIDIPPIQVYERVFGVPEPELVLVLPTTEYEPGRSLINLIYSFLVLQLLTN